MYSHLVENNKMVILDSRFHGNDNWDRNDIEKWKNKLDSPFCENVKIEYSLVYKGVRHLVH